MGQFEGTGGKSLRALERGLSLFQKGLDTFPVLDAVSVRIGIADIICYRINSILRNTDGG